MRQRLIAVLFATVLLSATPASRAAVLELALVLDGSSSISPGDFALQTGGYQSVFNDAFFTNFVLPGAFDQVVVGAYTFSGSNIDEDSTLPAQFWGEYAVFEFIPWTLIDSDQAAADFGDQFASLIQPGGQTNTSAALDIATSGGDINCPTGLTINNFPCTGVETVPGLLNNGFEGDELVIDISTDGVPTLPTGDGQPNPTDDALAIAAADAARAAGIQVNAIGVGGVDAAFLAALVGLDPAKDPAGFFLEAQGFEEFEDALTQKLRVELGIIPIPGALPLFLSALGGLVFWRRRTT